LLSKIEAFVGDAAVLGHNVQFDLGFMRARSILRYNDAIDTYDLAAVLLPSAGRYGLGSLAHLLNITQPATHRALDDCRATVAVYHALSEKAMPLPLDLLGEIVRHSQEISWGGELFFAEVLRARAKELAPARQAAGGPPGPLFANNKGERDDRALQRKSAH